MASGARLSLRTSGRVCTLNRQALGLAWVVLTAASPDRAPSPHEGPREPAAERLETELSYLTTATGFFVGFAWITLLRDLATLVARVGAASGAQEISYAGEALCVFVFGPVLTYVLIRGLSRHRRAAPSEVARLDGSSVAGHAWRELLLRIGLSPSSSLPGSPHGAPTHWTEVEVGEMQDYELEGDDRLPPRFSIDDSPRR